MHTLRQWEGDAPPPIKFEPCVGITVGLSRPHTHGQCYRCADWSNGRAGEARGQLLTSVDKPAVCVNFRPMRQPEVVLSRDQVAAVDETAGLHAPNVAHEDGAQPSHALGVVCGREGLL